MIPTPAQAMDLLKEFNEEPFHIKHGQTVGDVLRWFACELGYGRTAYNVYADRRAHYHWNNVSFTYRNQILGVNGKACKDKQQKQYAEHNRTHHSCRTHQ